MKLMKNTQFLTNKVDPSNLKKNYEWSISGSVPFLHQFLGRYITLFVLALDYDFISKEK